MARLSKKTIRVDTLYGRYAALLEPDEKKGYIVTVPGLSAVITWGKNERHAKKMAKEAIELCVECRVEESLRKAKAKRGASVRTPLAV